METTDKNNKKDFQTITVDIKSEHSANRQAYVQSLYNKSKQELISDIIIEMNAKNRAYFFILENGQLEAFTSYCKTKRNINP